MITITFNSERVCHRTVDYPGGELGVWLADDPADKRVGVVARIQNPRDLVELFLVSEAVLQRAKSATLTIPYFPYARQDRRTQDNEAFSLKVIAGLINTLGYRRVRVLDPHSDVTCALIDRIEIVHVWDILKGFNALPAGPGVVLVAPDAGAAKKVQRCASELGRRFITASKHRDSSTGTLTNFRLHEDAPEHCLIVDDIMRWKIQKIKD